MREALLFPGQTAGGSGAPTNGPYITTVADATLTSETVWGTTMFQTGTLAARPAAGAVPAGAFYFATDATGIAGQGAVYRSDGVATWLRVAIDGVAPWDGTATLAVQQNTSSATLVDTALLVPVLANARYDFAFALRIAVDATNAAGARYGFNLSAGAGGAVWAIGPGTTTGPAGAANVQMPAIATATSAALLTAASAVGMVQGVGSLLVGNLDADFIVQHLKVTAGVASIDPASWLKVRRVA